MPIGNNFSFGAGIAPRGRRIPRSMEQPLSPPPVAEGPGNGFDIGALTQAFLASQNQMSADRLTSDREARSGRHLGMDGMDVQPTPSPFGGPLQFEDAATRFEKMKQYGPPAAGSIPGRTDFDSNPYAFGALPQRPAPSMQSPATTPGSWIPSMDGGFDHVGGAEPGKRSGYVPPPFAPGEDRDTLIGAAARKKPMGRPGQSFGFQPSRPNFSAGIGY